MTTIKRYFVNITKARKVYKQLTELDFNVTVEALGTWEADDGNPCFAGAGCLAKLNRSGRISIFADGEWFKAIPSHGLDRSQIKLTATSSLWDTP
jgi:hypothetical protein